MEYEKKNKDAISTIKQALRQLSTNGVPVGNIIKAIKDIEEKYAESDDERIRGNIIATIHLYYGEPLEDEAKEMIAWLEKQGEQKIKTPEESLGIDSDTYNKIVDECIYGEQKPAWSEEDEKQARQIERIVHNDGCTQKLQKQIADWFESLKARYTWKPSEEQIEALESATENCAYSEYQGCLRELIEQLKKLKE